MTDTTTLTPEQLSQLSQPLDMRLIRHRLGAGGKQLKYISGHDAICAANRILGIGMWGYTVVARSHEIVQDGKKGPIEIYTCDIELHVTGAAFPFPGDGVGIVNAPYTAESHEQARKSATTDALKRALRHFGDQFALCLYDEDDYVDAGDGTLIQVREVTPAAVARAERMARPTRIVEASTNGTQSGTPITPPHLDESAMKQRLNAAFYAGKSQQLFRHKRGMAEYVTGVLGRTVLMDELTQLAEEELSKVEAALLQSSSLDQPDMQSA